jgi:hypothetical protein
VPRLSANWLGKALTTKRESWLCGKAPAGLAGAVNPVVRDIIRKLMIWIGILAVVILAILLPMIIVTGMLGGQPLAGSIALIGVVLLAFSVAWYVRTRWDGS